MNNEWRAVLTAAGAVIEGDAVRHFGSPPAEIAATAEGTVLCDLSFLALIRASGEDAEKFLQGQLSNDIRQVDAARSQLSAYNTPKGRMLAIFRVFRHADALLLQLPSALQDATLKRLRMYVLRDRVRLDAVGDDLIRIGLSGPAAEALLRDAVGAPPVEKNGCVRHGEHTVLRLPGPFPRFEIVGALTPMRTLWDSLRVAARPVGAPCWAWLDIQAGVPSVHPATVDEFVPQTANLDLVEGISFTKGCYPGQEIVARVHYLGRLKQRMIRAHVEAPAAPAPGDPVYASDPGGQAVGRVVDAQPAPRGGYDLLAVASLAARESAILRVGDPDGPPLTVHALPYTDATSA